MVYHDRRSKIEAASSNLNGAVLSTLHTLAISDITDVARQVFTNL